MEYDFPRSRTRYIMTFFSCANSSRLSLTCHRHIAWHLRTALLTNSSVLQNLSLLSLTIFASVRHHWKRQRRRRRSLKPQAIVALLKLTWNAASMSKVVTLHSFGAMNFIVLFPRAFFKDFVEACNQLDYRIRKLCATDQLTFRLQLRPALWRQKIEEN